MGFRIGPQGTVRGAGCSMRRKAYCARHRKGIHSMNGGITVAYSGVHQAYQIALAAQELASLDRFHCSVFDAAGKWGGLLATLFGRNTLINRRVAGLPLDKVSENPFPLGWQRLRGTILPSMHDSWLAVNDSFDRRVAKGLMTSSSRVFVG